MKEIIGHLVRLQSIGFEIKEAEALREEGPAKISRIEAEFQKRIEEIGSARLRHEALVKERQRLRDERATITKRLEQSQQKLMLVTNQREYSAVLNEIDASKASLSTIEEGIARCDGEIEQLSGPAAEADLRIEEERRAVDAARRDVDEALVGIDANLASLASTRKEIVAALPPALVQRFVTIAEGRGGVALAPISNGACGACRMRIRPQVVNLVRRGDDVHYCESCRRILYVEPESQAATASPTQNAEADATHADDAPASTGS